jgi:hypothetical protein
MHKGGRLKTRNGFVSNSSSSNFVMIGYKLDPHFDKDDFVRRCCPDKYRDIQAEHKASDLPMAIDEFFCCSTLGDGIQYLSSDNEGYLGKVLVDEEYFDEIKILDGVEFSKIMKEVQEFMGKDEPPSLIFGARAC